MSEAVIQDPAEFDNFNSFFTRALVPGTCTQGDLDAILRARPCVQDKLNSHMAIPLMNMAPE